MDYYSSPRWTNEILDCSMPMTFDTYNLCSYQCQYCFSFYQQSHYDDYMQKNMQHVNVEKVKKIFTDPDSSQFAAYVKKRIPMQWGGLSEPFDLREKEQGITLELLRFFRQINYPVSLSSKSVWHLKDDRYRDVLNGAKNFHIKVSIITYDEEKARKIEKGVPTPKERVWAIGEYVKLGLAAANLRLRPFIIGVSNPSHAELIKQVAAVGAYGVSTEFFCLEARAAPNVKARYKIMSDVAGYDIWEFYRRFSVQQGYRRLNYEVKRPYINGIKLLCAGYGLKLFVSDANHKEACAYGSCCCGVPDTGMFGKFAKCQFTQAILIAKKKGEVHFSDIASEETEYLKETPYIDAEGFNTANLANRAKHRYMSMFDHMRATWNNPKHQNSPYRYFDGILLPVRLDENNDVVYLFNQPKYEGTDTK